MDEYYSSKHLGDWSCPNRHALFFVLCTRVTNGPVLHHTAWAAVSSTCASLDWMLLSQFRLQRKLPTLMPGPLMQVL